MFESISYAEAPELGEVWVTVTPTTGNLYDWSDLRPHVLPEYRGLSFKGLTLLDDEDGYQETWVLSVERGVTQPVRCPACVRRVLRSTSTDEPSPPALVATDDAGIFGWAWCPGCGHRSFIPMIAQEVGADLTHDIDRSGSMPVLVEVFR